jgi:hypothetical protein
VDDFPLRAPCWNTQWNRQAPITSPISVTSCDIQLAAEPAETAVDSAIRFSDRSQRLRVQLELRDPAHRHALNAAVAAGIVQLVVGDYTEPGVNDPAKVCSNAALIDIDLFAGTVRAVSSVPGLPPIFYCESAGVVSLSCPFLPRAAQRSRSLDFEGVADTLRWGHPIDGRTLYANVRVVPAEATASLSIENELRISSSTRPCVSDSLLQLSPAEILEGQIEALIAAARRLPTEKAFISLSGGLDSRVALMSLLNQQRAAPCVTIAGTAATLDARLARCFCEAQGLDLQLVELGHDYLKRLPDLALRTAALTGGLSALSQTVDFYLYQQVAGQPQARISGNLGNQVGRGGVESLSVSLPHLEVLSPQLRTLLERRPAAPWFIPRMANKQFVKVLFSQEVHYWSIANYVVSSAFAAQLSPYADSTLVEFGKAMLLMDPVFDDVSWEILRMRDVRHRLRGQPADQSFQRAFLVRYDPAGRRVPINWGWLAAGGWSPKWRLATMASVADAAILKLARKFQGVAPPLRWVSAHVLGRPSALVAWPEVLRSELRDLTHDVLLSAAVLESGLVDAAALRRVLAEHFERRADHHSTIFALLEIGLGLHVRARGFSAAARQENVFAS